MENKGEIVIFESEDGLAKLNVNLKDDNVWLSLDQMAILFDRDKSTISRHISNVFEDNELIKDSVVANFATTAKDGKVYDVDYYNLDMIISVGYRVKSKRGVQFRIWATNVLKEYIKKGFALDDDRLKNLGGGNYWKELLDRIRDIRSSEKVMYRQLLDLYATAVDYNPKSEETIEFFKIVQNKFHYATNNMTAAEVIYERADSTKPFMGLKTFTGNIPIKKDIKIAKNYLDESELKILSNLVSGYFDLAEVNAIEHKPMYMKDYIENIDSLLNTMKRPILSGGGKISHEDAIKKAEIEYKKYQVENLSEVEKEYLKSIQLIDKKAKKWKERYGTGVQRIQALYNGSVSQPIFEVSDNLIKIVLPLLSKTTQTIQTLTDKTTQITQRTTPSDDNTTPKTTPNDDNTTPKKTIDIIIALIKSNNKITAAEIADKVDLTRDGVRYHLDNMKNKEMIKHCGTVQNGYWEILKED